MRLKAYLFVLFRPVLLRYLLWRYGGIWGLKEHLRTTVPAHYSVQAYEYYFTRLGSWIGHRAQFGGTPCFPHGPVGVFISHGAVLGRNVVIFQQVTIGSNSLSDTATPGSPRIGDAVYIGAGAKIIGGITVAHNCRIGANAVVYSDLPPNSVAVQAPTRVLTRAKLDNRYVTERADGIRVYFDDGRWIPVGDANAQSDSVDVSLRKSPTDGIFGPIGAQK